MKVSGLCVLASALLLSGCVNGPRLVRSGTMHYDWENFEGEQREWPTSTEAFCRRLDGLEIYGRGQLPRRPYQMLGRIKLGTNPIRGRETPDQALVRICRQHGADGVVLVNQKSARTEYGTLVTVWWYDAFRYRPETSSPATQLHDPSQSLGIRQVPAQQTEADRKLFESIKTEAELGDVNSQCIIAVCFADGLLGVNTNAGEAVKWFRKAAEQGNSAAQCMVGICYAQGEGVSEDPMQAVAWFRKAASQGNAQAQALLGASYADGIGVTKNQVEAVTWYRKAAEQGYAIAQYDLGFCYFKGYGVAEDDVEAVKWFRKAAEHNDAQAQAILSWCYYEGSGVPKDYVEGYKWTLLAAAQGNEIAKKAVGKAEATMSREQIAEGQKLAREFSQHGNQAANKSASREVFSDLTPKASGTAFFVSEDGFLISNAHVVEGAAQVRLVTGAGLISGKVVKVDAANDLALLKAEGRFAPLPIAASRGVKLGGTVATVGFPNIGLQGFAPKLAKGEIASLSGAQDDARYFQISVPVQPGNSGGALVDERGNVVGVVSAKLSARAALAASGTLPENVNYAVKSSYLLSFLESVPDVAVKLIESRAAERKFEEVVKDAEQAAVLVLVY